MQEVRIDMEDNETDYENLSRFFIAISNDPDEKDVASVYLTAASILKNCPKYWGHPCEWFATRLHEILSDNVPIKRIYFRTFKEKFYDTLISTQNSNRHRTAFIFKMLDVDGDGMLNETDLLKAFEMNSMQSKFGKELHRMMKWYTSKNIL